MQTKPIMAIHIGVLAAAVALLSAACNSGGGGGAPQPPALAAIAVSVSGLNPGRTLILQNNGGDNLTVSADGTHGFATPVASGAGYAVTISGQPAGQTCFVANGSGVAGDGAAGAISVTCPHFVYVANQDSNDISAFRIDLATGALAPVPGSPFAAGVAPSDVVVSADGRFAYVASRGGVAVYGIDAATGALSHLTDSPASAGRFPVSVRAEPGGDFLHVVEADDYYSEPVQAARMVALRIDAATGALGPVAGSALELPFLPSSVAIHPSGRAAYLALNDTIRPYAIDPVSRALSPMASGAVQYGYQTTSVAVHPDGRFVYYQHFFLSDHPPRSPHEMRVDVYSADPATGAVGAASGQSILLGTDPRYLLLVLPNGKFAYSPGSSNGYDFRTFAVDAATGDLSPQASLGYAVGGEPRDLATDAGGRFIYVANEPWGVVAYRVDAATGTAVLVADVPYAAGTRPVAIAVR
jgi:6-phosphogluconolactonase (cycloisomerase 2 family)